MTAGEPRVFLAPQPADCECCYIVRMQVIQFAVKEEDEEEEAVKSHFSKCKTAAPEIGQQLSRLEPYTISVLTNVCELAHSSCVFCLCVHI